MLQNIFVAALYKELKDTEFIQHLLQLGRTEGQIIAKTKMMRTKFLKAARDKKQPVEKPKAKRKVNSNIGKAGPSGEDAHKTTSWSPEEEMALRTIQSYVMLDKEAWKVQNIQKWLESGTTTDELRELYSKLKNGRLNKNRTLREDSAMISKFNRMKHQERRLTDENQNEKDQKIKNTKLVYI